MSAGMMMIGASAVDANDGHVSAGATIAVSVICGLFGLAILACCICSCCADRLGSGHVHTKG